MLSILYDLGLLLIGLLALPRLLWHFFVKGKYRQSVKERLGLVLPSFAPFAGQKTIWIHAVSVGEVRAAAALYVQLRREYPKSAIIISTTTETGQAEARRTLTGADAIFYLPFDFSPVVKRYLARLRPDVLILVESDFWYNLITLAKKRGVKLLLVNGKISEKSFKRFCLLKPFARVLFAPFDRMCVQNGLYKERFEELGVSKDSLAITGNMKLDISINFLTNQEKQRWQEDLGLADTDKVLVIGSTHAPEELQLLEALEPLMQKHQNLKIIFVPRHPERFEEVDLILKKSVYPSLKLSQKEAKTGRERIILIDRMGLLAQCYQLADIAIVAGSFTDKVGGHNVFEPVQVGTPVLFGPYMFSQKDLRETVLAGSVGKQVSLANIALTIDHLFQDPEELLEMKKKCLLLSSHVKGSAQRTYREITPFLPR